MKPYSMDLREKIVSAVEKGEGSIRKIAKRFAVSKNTVERLMSQKRSQGHVIPRKQGGSMVSPVLEYQDQLLAIVEERSDATLAEYCELVFDQTGLWVSQSTMCRTLQRLNLPRKKNTPLQPSDERTRPAVETSLLGKRDRCRPKRPSFSG